MSRIWTERFPLFLGGALLLLLLEALLVLPKRSHLMSFEFSPSF